MLDLVLAVKRGVMNILSALTVRLGIDDAGYAGLALRVSARLPFVIVLFIALGVAGAARAENECGWPQAGTPIVCSPSNYNAATDGNIVYRPSEAIGREFIIRLTDDLSLLYDHRNPNDDQLIFPDSEDPLYSAVWIDTNADYEGNIS